MAEAAKQWVKIDVDKILAAIPTKLLAVPERRRLRPLARELFWLSSGAVALPEIGRVFYVDGGIVPLPQTKTTRLILDLATSKPFESRTILANEVLAYLASAHRAGHAEAVPDALRWCSAYRLPVPDWLRDAPPKAKRPGTRPVEKRQDQIWSDLMRFLAVEIATHQIAAERKRGVGRDPRRGRDRYERAKELLRDGWADTPSKFSTKGFNKSYDRFKNHRDSYYFSPALLMRCLKGRAPLFHKILS